MRTAVERAFPGVARILDERMRQKFEEGFTNRHDDVHDKGELAAAACCYAFVAELQSGAGDAEAIAEMSCSSPPESWPFEAGAWKPSADPARNLEIAGALIAADLERVLRARDEYPPAAPDDPCVETRDLLGDMSLPVRLLKIQEETGEAAEAFLGMTGANPRKGVTNGRGKLEEEMLDVALTALVAWVDVNGGENPLFALRLHAEARNERHRREVGHA